MLPDTHAHLDASAFAADIEHVIRRAEDAGVDRILAVGSDLASSEAAIDLAGRYDIVYAAVGVHPHHADLFEGEAERVRQLLSEDVVVAVGEIGLDYYRDTAARELQVIAFRAQLAWARERGLPASIHNRSADQDIFETLRSSGVMAVLHCFSGSASMAASAAEEGMYISFAGNVTYPRASSLREAVKAVPANRLLLETDSPVLAPQPWRGRRNEPAFVGATLEVVARERSLDCSDLADLVSQNADRVFSWRDM